MISKLLNATVSLILTMTLLLSLAIPGYAVDDTDESMYQPSSEFGTYLGMREDGVYEFDITIPVGQSSYYPLAAPSRPYSIYTNHQSSDTDVVTFRNQYLHGVAPGTATVEYHVYHRPGEAPHLKVIAYVTVVPKDEFDPSVNVGFANVKPPESASINPGTTPGTATTPSPATTAPVSTVAPDPIVTSVPTPEPIPTDPGTTTDPGVIAGSDGSACSDRGNTLHRRDDGNYEQFYIKGIQTWLADGSTVDTRKLYLTTMTPEFKEISTIELSKELDEFGSCYFGKDYNFLIFGQDNFGESSSVEVLRIVKYSKDWKRLGAASLCQSTVTDVIGQHGNLSFSEAGGMLYIHSGRTTEKLSKDGNNHQCNMTFCIRVSDMTVTDGLFRVANNSVGYVSHALAQDIIVDQMGNIITLDTGDGNPWGAMLFKYNTRAGGEKFTGKGTPVIIKSWPGERTDIRTGATTCALVETSQGYLSAYLDSGKGASYNVESDPFSAYLAFTPKDDFSLSATQTRTVQAGTFNEELQYMYLIPTSSEGGYVMWYTSPVQTGRTPSYNLYYATYSADGSIGPSKRLDNADIPINGPIYADGKVVWGGDTNAQGGPKFYTLDASGVIKVYSGTFDNDAPVNFTDVHPEDYFEEAVKWAVKKNITDGTSPTTFSPNQTCTVAHIITFLWRAKGSPLAVLPGEFSDVSSSDYYYEAARWAKERGLVSGDKFNPNAPCTRSMVVYYLWQLAVVPDVPYNNDFTDVRTRDKYATAVAWAVQQGITNGTSPTTFGPNETCTRGQIVTFLYRAYA